MPTFSVDGPRLAETFEGRKQAVGITKPSKQEGAPTGK